MAIGRFTSLLSLKAMLVRKRLDHGDKTYRSSLGFQLALTPSHNDVNAYDTIVCRLVSLSPCHEL